MIQLNGIKIFAKIICKTGNLKFARIDRVLGRWKNHARMYQRMRYLDAQFFVTDETTEPGEYPVEKRNEGYESHDIRDYTQNDW